MSYSIAHIAGVVHAKLVAANADAPVQHLLTDSRKVVFPAASLFFALHSTLRDGHSFIPELYERGVRNFCVCTYFDTVAFPAANFLLVPDPLTALQELAAYHRQQFHYPVIGITGSNGKTIVKEWLYQLLSPDFTIIRSPRSYNSQTGVPLSVWNMSERYNLAIFEAGISLPGEMEKLQTIIQPTLGVFTTIGDAHSEGFESIHQKALEKAILFRQAAQVVFNADETLISKALNQTCTHKNFYTYSKQAHGNIQLLKVEKQAGWSLLSLQYDLSKQIVLHIPFTDDASMANVLTCFTVCMAMQLPAGVIQQRIARLQHVEMRLQLLPAINNCAVINDSYSFDLNALQIALDFLLQQNQFNRHTVILSDLPAGFSDNSYNEVVTLLLNKKVHRLITIGIAWEQKDLSYVQERMLIERFSGTDAFIQHFNATHFKNEIILLKGARIFAFEKLLPLLEQKVHQTAMEINLTAIAGNLKQYRQLLGSGVKLMAMVKAYGYGSGSAEVANVLQFHKVDYLAVAYADEAIELRKAGIHLPVMVLNVDEAAFGAVIEYSLEPEIYSFEILRSFLRFLKQQALQLYPVHIKIDTGMHRLGFEEKDIPSLVEIIKDNAPVIMVKSILSHLAASEDPAEDEFTHTQLSTFTRCANALEKATGYSSIKHIANTAAIFRHPRAQLDMVRLGIGLYGIDSAHEHSLRLQTVATLKTTIAQLRTVKSGDTIGYNRRGKVLRDSLIATIRIGYADGFSRHLGNGNGHVCIRGALYPVIGAVCMDMTMIDVTGISAIQVGDEVEIFGVNLPIEKVARWAGTIPYEILTGISQRVKRIYIEE